MAFNPDDKIQWENLAPTLQALLEKKIQDGSKQYFDSNINRYVNIAINSSNKYTDSKDAVLRTLLETNKDAITNDMANLSNNNQAKYAELKRFYDDLNSRLNGKEFIKSKDKVNNIEFKYEKKKR